MRHFSYKSRTDAHILYIGVTTIAAAVLFLLYLGLTNQAFQTWLSSLSALLKWPFLWLPDGSEILFFLLGSGLTSLAYFFTRRTLQRSPIPVKTGSSSQSTFLTNTTVSPTIRLNKIQSLPVTNPLRDSGKIATPSLNSTRTSGKIATPSLNSIRGSNKIAVSSLPTQTTTHLQARYTVRADTVSHTGIVRQHRPNEDSYFQMVTTRPSSPFTTQSVGLFIVADGMGGHNYGRYASTMLTNTIRSAIEADLRNPEVGCEELKKKLIQAIQQANIRLSQERQKSGVLCGTTVTGTLLFEQPSVPGQTTPSYTAHVINVGDSRTYQYVPGHGLSRITRDHSLVEEMVVNGLITDEERYTHKDRNKIYRCIGEKEDLDIETFTISLKPGNRLLICSDGLWEMVRDADIAPLLSSPSNEPSVITDQLLQAAINRGGRDNVTATVVLLVDETETENAMIVPSR